MGAYNILEVEGAAERHEIQFKFGDCWLFRYRIGDTITWGGNDVGTAGLRRVLVAGVAFDLTNDTNYVITVEHDVIMGCAPMDAELWQQFIDAQDWYLVVEK